MTVKVETTTRRTLFAGAIALPLVATPALALATDDIQVFETERQRAWAEAQAAHDEDEVARLADVADAWDVKIRQAPCASKQGAVLKLQSVQRGLDWGERFDAPVQPEDVIAQVIAWLGGRDG
jgi:hypothetical protein